MCVPLRCEQLARLSECLLVYLYLERPTKFRQVQIVICKAVYRKDCSLASLFARADMAAGGLTSCYHMIIRTLTRHVAIL